MSKRVTIDDVARLAKVHKATVSRALNEQTADMVHGATAERVRQAARELGYVPNAMARALRVNVSMTIGIVVPDLMNPIFPPIVRGIERVLQPRGYTVLVANTDGHADVEAAAIESLTRRRVDGFILATGRLDDEQSLAAAHADGIHVVMVNREAAAGAPYPSVSGDNTAGVALSLDHLLELGHTRLLYLAGPQNYSTTRSRAIAFQSLVRGRNGLTTSVVEVGELTAEAGSAAMDRVLSSPGPLPTAVLAGNDLVALGVLRSVRRHGLRCPEDISVVGFNDMTFAEDFCPPLTTVHLPLVDIGAEAARILLAGIEDGEPRRSTVELPVSLVVRKSTGPAPRSHVGSLEQGAAE
ncbi:LacI family DNA-binding transcriptional regulator [Microcella alkalica]|uniref:LacI family transcriptional regulator n=1 Tax=Microcella alkalica TaxID=355930 RepID=A0A839EAJ1_9MICO|nr:LacI family transcriptional regulator [Microcella alkalica]